jgi:hypothetical protein
MAADEMRLELRVPGGMVGRIERYRAGMAVPSHSRNRDICVLLDMALSVVEGQRAEEVALAEARREYVRMVSEPSGPVWPKLGVPDYAAQQDHPVPGDDPEICSNGSCGMTLAEARLHECGCDWSAGEGG